MRRVLPLTLLLASSCMVQHMTAQEKLREAVFELTDALRWNRMDVAGHRVAPKYQHRFVEARRFWGRMVQVADAELVAIQMGDDKSEAKSSVAVRWYNQRTMTVHEAVLQQKWERHKRHYFLVDEQVLQGDPNLLAPPLGEDDDAEKTAQAPGAALGG
jgi:hypothetical protein